MIIDVHIPINIVPRWSSRSAFSWHFWGQQAQSPRALKIWWKLMISPWKLVIFPEEWGIPWISGFSQENMMFSRIFRGIWWEIFWGEDSMGFNGIANMIWGISWWMFETFYFARFGSMFDLDGAQREGHLCAGITIRCQENQETTYPLVN